MRRRKQCCNKYHMSACISVPTNDHITLLVFHKKYPKLKIYTYFIYVKKKQKTWYFSTSFRLSQYTFWLDLRLLDVQKTCYYKEGTSIFLNESHCLGPRRASQQGTCPDPHLTVQQTKCLVGEKDQQTMWDLPIECFLTALASWLLDKYTNDCF